MPISALAYTIRMEGVRHANIHPTCRLDKSNRALYEPEDVWAKRAALAKIDSRSGFTGKTKGLLKQRVITMSTTRVTKEDMEAVDRVKQVGSAVEPSPMYSTAVPYRSIIQSFLTVRCGEFMRRNQRRPSSTLNTLTAVWGHIACRYVL